MAGVSGVTHTNPPTAYFLNDYAEGDPMYIGKSAGGNVWLVQKFSTTTGVMGYATQVNNPAISDYASAWAAKTTLTYGTYQSS
jgi:hypothetical protein